jgi:hypothetical protein
MRLLALLPVMAFPAISGGSFACPTPPDSTASAKSETATTEASGDDCALIAAVVKEKY